MISNLSSWAEQIIIAIIVATIFEMLIPECKNKKYVKTVIGIYILFTILSPIMNISNRDISLASSEYFNFNESQYNMANNITNNNIEDTYILSLKQDITSKLNQKGYIAANIKLEIDTNSTENYGQIKSLYMIISKKPQENSENIGDNNSISIDKIEIRNTNKKDIDNNTIEDNEKKDIKEYIFNEYGIDINNIKID